jgi:hypothetical protein
MKKAIVVICFAVICCMLASCAPSPKETQVTLVSPVVLAEAKDPQPVYWVLPGPWQQPNTLVEDPYRDAGQATLCVPIKNADEVFSAAFQNDPTVIVTSSIFSGKHLKSFEAKFSRLGVDDVSGGKIAEDELTLVPNGNNETQVVNHWLCNGDPKSVVRDMAYGMKDKYPKAVVKLDDLVITSDIETHFVFNYCRGGSCPIDKTIGWPYEELGHQSFFATIGVGLLGEVDTIFMDTNELGFAGFDARIEPTEENIDIILHSINVYNQNMYPWGGGADYVVNHVDGNTVYIDLIFSS